MAIERAATRFGFPVGPLELTDMVGIDVAAHVAEHMHRAYGPRMAPAPLWAQLRELPRGRDEKLIQRSWRGGRRLNRSVARAIRRARRAQGVRRRGTPEADALVERLVYPIINEAARALEEGIVEQPEQIDLAMVFGTGFAPFRGGPLRYADHVGLGRIVQALDRLAAEHPRLAPCEALRQRAAEGRSFLEPIPDQVPAAVA
jgi:3-hydroxyacyl-CoA dehydrogenase/enoyl-CoA hydratase/3-hydroxybutyryl-CoA epimerase